jgi:hypothetical protein
VILYTVPTGVQTVVRNIRITNPYHLPVTFSLYVNGSTDDETYLPDTTLDPGEVYADTDALILEDGETIEALVSISGALTFHVFGMERVV